jgi:hypothetical protein
MVLKCFVMLVALLSGLSLATVLETVRHRRRLALLQPLLVLAAGFRSAPWTACATDTSYRRADEVRDTAGVRVAVAAMVVALVLVVGGSFFVAHDNQSLVTMLSPDESAAKR